MAKPKTTTAIALSPQSRMVETNPQSTLIPVQEAEYVEIETIDNNDFVPQEASEVHFIESNTSSVSYQDLQNDLIPTYATGESVIYHTNFIEEIQMAMADVFHGESFGLPTIRCSHKIEGRKPEAKFKSKDQIQPSDLTRFWQRAAFCIEIPSITTNICGEPVVLTVGGTSSLHDVNLFSKRSSRHFSYFVSFKCRICSNQMINIQYGLKDRVECFSPGDIYSGAVQLFSQFNIERDIQALSALGNVRITSDQFATLVGKLRLLSVLPTAAKKQLPSIELGDGQVLEACRNFVNGHFGLQDGQDSINGFELLNCFNAAAKNSYIHNYCAKVANCVTLTTGVCESIAGTSHEYDWFLRP